MAFFIANVCLFNPDPNAVTYCFPVAGGTANPTSVKGGQYDHSVMILRWVHLVCTVALIGSNMVYSSNLSVTAKIFEKFVGFMTVPIYFFAIIYAQTMLINSRIPSNYTTVIADLAAKKTVAPIYNSGLDTPLCIQSSY